MGSEKGMPNSIISAPESTRACNKSKVISGCGSPAVIKGINAFFFLFESSVNVELILDIFFLIKLYWKY